MIIMKMKLIVKIDPDAVIDTYVLNIKKVFCVKGCLHE